MQMILRRWPTRQALADDAGVDLYAVHRWFQRGRVNGRHDMSLLSGAQRRGINLTALELVEARARDMTEMVTHGQLFKGAAE